MREVITTDGIKLRLGPSHWLMLRFSGTEPLLRLYCEAPDAARVNAVLSLGPTLRGGRMKTSGDRQRKPGQDP